MALPLTLIWRHDILHWVENPVATFGEKQSRGKQLGGSKTTSSDTSPFRPPRACQTDRSHRAGFQRATTWGAKRRSAAYCLRPYVPTCESDIDPRCCGSMSSTLPNRRDLPQPYVTHHTPFNFLIRRIADVVRHPTVSVRASFRLMRDADKYVALYLCGEINYLRRADLGRHRTIQYSANLRVLPRDGIVVKDNILRRMFSFAICISASRGIVDVPQLRYIPRRNAQPRWPISVLICATIAFVALPC